MGRRGYPPEFRRKVVDLVEAGQLVADVARDLEISEQSIYTWRRQARIDRGLVLRCLPPRRGPSPTVATRRSSELLTSPLTVRGDLTLCGSGPRPLLSPTA
jgi:transposase-like protein